MGRVAKYRANQIAKSGIELKSMKQPFSSSNYNGSVSKKDSVKELIEKHYKNSR